MTEKQIMLSLGDSRIKHISEVMGNKTCIKILDYLTEHEATVSEISSALDIPLNTADYNVKKLMKAEVIEKATSFWSVKGKKMPSYKVSNKRIIISPKKSVAKNFLWTLGITGFAAVMIKYFTSNISYASQKTADYIAGPEVGLMMESSSRMVEATPVVANNLAWAWFLIGAWMAIALYIIISKLSKKGGSK